MTIVYKLTDQNMQTHNGYQWTLNVKHTASGEGELCGPGWLHAYTHPLLAVLLKFLLSDIEDPRLFEGEGTIGKTNKGLKVGCTELTLTKELELPVITTEQRVRFAILCAKKMRENKAWNKWADNWLSGKDRSIKSALAAARKAASNAGEAAERAARAADIDLIAIAKEAVYGNHP